MAKNKWVNVRIDRWFTGWEMGYKVCMEDALEAAFGRHSILRSRHCKEALRKRLKRALARRLKPKEQDPFAGLPRRTE